MTREQRRQARQLRRRAAREARRLIAAGTPRDEAIDQAAATVRVEAEALFAGDIDNLILFLEKLFEFIERIINLFGDSP